MKVKLQNVESSNLEAIGHDEESKTLVIKFKNGAVYSYSDVPAEILEDTLTSSSAGAFFSKNIAKSFSYKRESTALITGDEIEI